jgi:hypothetical protein
MLFRERSCCTRSEGCCGHFLITLEHALEVKTEVPAATALAPPPTCFDPVHCWYFSSSALNRSSRDIELGSANDSFSESEVSWSPLELLPPPGLDGGSATTAAVFFSSSGASCGALGATWSKPSRGSFGFLLASMPAT